MVRRAPLVAVRLGETRCEPVAPPVVILYRRQWSQAVQQTIRLHVTADERYELWLDGIRLGEGPERCTPDRWAYETYEIEVPAGRHELVARVWSLGPLAPWAQTSVQHGFLCAPQPVEWAAVLGSGVASWEWRRDTAWSFRPVTDPLGPRGMGGVGIGAGRVGRVAAAGGPVDGKRVGPAGHGGRA